MSQPGAAFTCITCRVQFNDADLQRSHYKTDWHRYNLKRKVADMPPVTAENFLQRVLSQRAQASETEKDASAHCTLCNKHFSTSNQYQNHVQSRKHKEAEARDQRKVQAEVDEMNQKNKSKDNDDTSEVNSKAESKHAENEAIKARLGQESSQDTASTSGTAASNSGTAASTSGTAASTSGITASTSGTTASTSGTTASTSRLHGAKAPVNSSGAGDDVEMESDAESCEEWDGDALGLEECLFCPKVSTSLENNVEHMSKAHSFFIPDLDFISDFEGLMSYLGEKVGEGHICLWCNERSKTFLSTQAVQKHMADKGHCKLKFEGDAIYEYSDYYDYRSSYPDYDPSADRERESGDEEEDEVAQNLLEETDYQLVLPSGATIGHRTLQRYYRQNIRPDRGTRTNALTRALAQYRSLGWTGTTSVDARKRAKDIQHMQRVKKQHHIQLGIKANKMQHHYRPQVIF